MVARPGARMRTKLLFVSIVAASLTLSACSHVTFTEHVPMTEKITAWRSLSIEVYAAPELRDAEPGSLSTLQQDLEDRAKRSTTGLAVKERLASDLALRVFVRRLDKGSVLYAKAKLVADVELVETKPNRLLGRFTVETTSGGSSGAQWDFAFDSATEVAIKRASVRIVKWLNERD
jgi:hypothetical protein